MIQEYPNGPRTLVRAEGVTLAEQKAKAKVVRGPYKKSETAKKPSDSTAPVKRVMDYNAIVAAASTAQSAAALAVSRIIQPPNKTISKTTPNYIQYDSTGPPVARAPLAISDKQLEFRIARTKRIAEENEAKKAAEGLKSIKRVMEDVVMKETLRKHIDAQPRSVVMIQRFGSLKEESYTCVSQLWGNDSSLIERWSLSEYPPELYWEYMVSEDDFKERGFSIVINASTVDTVQVYGLNPLEKESAGTSLLKKIVDSSFVIFCGQMPTIKADVIMIVNSEAVSGRMIAKQLSKLKVHHEHNYFLVAFSKKALFTLEPPEIIEPVYAAPLPVSVSYSHVGGSGLHGSPPLPPNNQYYPPPPPEPEQYFNENDAAALSFARSFTSIAPGVSLPKKAPTAPTHATDRIAHNSNDHTEGSFHRSKSEDGNRDHDDYSPSNKSKRKLEKEEAKRKIRHESKEPFDLKTKPKPNEVRSSSSNIYGDAPDNYVSQKNKGKDKSASYEGSKEVRSSGSNVYGDAPNTYVNKNQKTKGKGNSTGVSDYTSKSSDRDNSSHNKSSNSSNSSSRSSSSAKGYDGSRDKRKNDDRHKHESKSEFKKRKLSSSVDDDRGFDNQHRNSAQDGYSRRHNDKEPYRGHKEPGVRAPSEPSYPRQDTHTEHSRGTLREFSGPPLIIPRSSLVAPLEFPPKRSNHNSPHSRPPEPLKKRTVCTFFLQGNCTYGSGCRNLHEPPQFETSGRGSYVPPPSPYDQYMQRSRGY